MAAHANYMLIICIIHYTININICSVQYKNIVTLYLYLFIHSRMHRYISWPKCIPYEFYSSCEEYGHNGATTVPHITYDCFFSFSWSNFMDTVYQFHMENILKCVHYDVKKKNGSLGDEKVKNTFVILHHTQLYFDYKALLIFPNKFLIFQSWQNVFISYVLYVYFHYCWCCWFFCGSQLSRLQLLVEKR